ncbi:MAG: Ig-like domain-containing protein [Archangium sp.]
MTAPAIDEPAPSATVGPTPTMKGSAAPGAFLWIFLDGAYVSAVQAAPDGKWSFAPPAPIADGAHELVVQANDGVGNGGEASAPTPFTVAAVPVAAVVAPPAPVAASQACPITDEFLADNMKKHVDPRAPVPLRMMAAKALVPLQPPDMLSVLFMLSFDAEENVRAQVQKTSSTLQDRIAASGFRDESVHPPVLGWFLNIYAANDVYAEMLILNPNTPDEAVAAIADSCSKRTAEIIGQNQLRLLRHDNIIRGLARNANTAGALIDGVCDFAVRNGLILDDVPQMKEAKIRLYGPESAVQPLPQLGPTADQIMAEFHMPDAEGAEQGTPPLDEGVRLSLSKRIMSMNVSEKIKLATKGNKEARGILIRDSNKLVSVAVIRSPRITDGEVLAQAQNKICVDDVLRVIYSNREWLRKYSIKLALVKNPKVPQGVSMRLMNTLHEHDIKTLAKDKNVPGSVQMLAKKHIDKKNAPKRDDAK